MSRRPVTGAPLMIELGRPIRVSRGFFAGRGGPVIAVSALVSKHRDAGRVSWRNGGADPSAPPPMPQPNRLSGRSTHSAAIWSLTASFSFLSRAISTYSGRTWRTDEKQYEAQVPLTI